MNLNAQRRMASKLLKCGKNRVFIDPYMGEDVSVCITNKDIRNLVNTGVIKGRYPKGVSRSRAKAIHEQKKKGRRSGPGTRKGPAGSRAPEKRDWIHRIRGIRVFLKVLRDKNHIDTKTYQKYYALAKGGSFRNVGQLKRFMQEKGTLKMDKK